MSEQKSVTLLPCPFCGSKEVDPEGWASIDKSGPACPTCEGSCDTVERWNSRPSPPAAGLSGLTEKEMLLSAIRNAQMWMAQGHIKEANDFLRNALFAHGEKPEDLLATPERGTAPLPEMPDRSHFNFHTASCRAQMPGRCCCFHDYNEHGARWEDALAETCNTLLRYIRQQPACKPVDRVAVVMCIAKEQWARKHGLNKIAPTIEEGLNSLHYREQAKYFISKAGISADALISAGMIAGGSGR